MSNPNVAVPRQAGSTEIAGQDVVLAYGDVNAEYEALRVLSREAAKRKRAGATSNHDDLYDEFGLPK